jgi:hypothetical protein
METLLTAINWPLVASNIPTVLVSLHVAWTFWRDNDHARKDELRKTIEDLRGRIADLEVQKDEAKQESARAAKELDEVKRSLDHSLEITLGNVRWRKDASGQYNTGPFCARCGQIASQPAMSNAVCLACRIDFGDWPHDLRSQLASHLKSNQAGP